MEYNKSPYKGDRYNNDSAAPSAPAALNFNPILPLGQLSEITNLSQVKICHQSNLVNSLIHLFNIPYTSVLLPPGLLL